MDSTTKATTVVTEVTETKPLTSGEQAETKETEAIGTSIASESGKRFIPEHKKPDAALTFPEKVSFLSDVASCLFYENAVLTLSSCCVSADELDEICCEAR